MGRERNWTAEEREYLEENWGSVSIPSMMKRLSRSENAIKVMAQRLGLSAFLVSGDYITLNQLRISLGQPNGGGYLMTSWVKNRAFPVHTRRVNKNSFRVVYLDEFWKWAERNQSFIDFSRFEENALGIEPEWAKEKRKRDCRRRQKITSNPWTPADDDKLKHLLSQYRYSYKDLSRELGRTEGAIQRRINDLKLKARPIKADNHIMWTPSEFETLGQMIKEGHSYEEMSQVIGKSAKAIRGRVFQMYLTENLDRARFHINGGIWGDGRPERQLRQRLQMSVEEKGSVQSDISKLIYLLLQRAREISPVSEEYKDYWQKDMCANWDNAVGCTAGESSCDTCTSFQRIQPQYCKRCGITFYTRRESLFCPDCLKAKRNQYLKKSAVLAARKERK